MDKYVTSGALKKTIDLTKEELQDKDTRLSNIENSTPTTLTCENVITTVPANVQNNLKLTSVQGQTLQNLSFNHDINDARFSSENGYIKPKMQFPTIYLNELTLIKPNTTYTFVFDIKENTMSTTYFRTGGTNGQNYFNNGTILINANETGIKKVKLTSISDFSSCSNAITFGYHGSWDSSTEYVKFRLMILEGDYTNKEVPPYFEGIQSVQKDIDVQVTGKNLFDGMLETGAIDATTGLNTSTTNRVRSVNYIPVNPNTNITFTRYEGSGNNVYIYEYDKNKNKLLITSLTNELTKTFTTTSNTHYLRFIDKTNNLNGKFQIENSSTETTYEPYKSHNFTLPNEYELRSLPNGVKDEIVDGKLIKRVENIRLDSNLNYGASSDYISIKGITNIKLATTGNTLQKCCNCTHIPNNQIWIGSGAVAINMVNGLFSTLEEFKTLIDTNEVYIYYELAEPEIIDLKHPIYNNPIIQAYTNGNIILKNTPIHPSLTFEYNTGLQGKLNQVEIELQENQNAIREMVTNVTGEQVVNERVNDLVVQDTNIKLENLKGNTVQNLADNIVEFKGSSSEYYTTTSITNGTKATLTSPSSLTYFYCQAGGTNTRNLLKPNTTYTIVFDVDISSSSLNIAARIMDGSTANPLTTYTNTVSMKNGKFVGTFVSNATLTLSTQWIYISVSGSNNLPDNSTISISNVMLLEGDWTNKEIPSYFTGIKSVNEEQTGLSVKSVGKNLFNENLLTGTPKVEKDGQTWFYDDGTDTAKVQTIYINSGKQPVTLTMDYTSLNGTDSATFAVKTCGGRYLFKSLLSDNKISKRNGTFNDGIEYIDFLYWGTGKIWFKNIQAEYGTTATEYEPYKESIITIPYTEPLRKLPNGVCDEVVNGKVIRRVGKVVLNGSESISKYSSGTYTFMITTSKLSENYSNSTESNFIICDKLKQEKLDTIYQNRNTSGFSYISLKTDGIVISVNSLTEISDFKTWLQSNNLTIYYQLATPIEEEIPEITLAGYKYLIFNNDIVPIEGAISYANSMISRLKALEDSNVSHSKTIADLCAVVDFLTLQIGTLTNS